MSGVERSPGRRPRRIGRERTESPHVDHPIDARNGFEAKRRNGIEDRQCEADRVRNLKAGRKRQRQKLAGDQQRETDVQQVSRQRWRRVQVADIALVPIENTVDREGPAIQEYHPNDESPKCGADLLPAPCSLDRKSTRLNSSHSQISYAVFCLKKKKKTKRNHHTQRHKMNDYDAPL